MTEILPRILFSLAIGGAIYLTIASVLVLTGKPGTTSKPRHDIRFDELNIDYGGLPALLSFTARDGTTLQYRHYPAGTNTVLVMAHGSGYQSRYLMRFAQQMASDGVAQVVTPDLRGHGPNPVRRGDIDYIDQMVDDLHDLIQTIRAEQPDARIIVGGHSSGGGLALRFAESAYNTDAAGFLLLAPYVAYNAPTVKPNAGWATVFTRRIIGLVMLNNIGIRLLNNQTVITFDMPAAYRDGTETLSYTYRLNTGYAPDNYKKALRAIKVPLLVIVGSADELFHADQYQPLIAEYTAGEVRVIEGVTHMGAAVDPQVLPLASAWLADRAQR